MLSVVFERQGEGSREVNGASQGGSSPAISTGSMQQPGFRSKWSAEFYTAAASVIATERLYGLTALQAMANALAGKPVMIRP